MILGGIVGGGSLVNKGVSIVGSGISAIGNVLGIGNNRGAKREKRDRLRDALVGAGVDRGTIDNVHSDDWRELKKLAQFVQDNGKMAVAYLNETMPRGGFGGRKGPTASQVTANFQSWKQSKQPPSSAWPGQSPSMATPTANTGKAITDTMLYIALGIAALFLLGPKLRGK